ncbi:sigma-54 interaction domain-containing protein [Evansella clarkii]|uniref:sigma-54 interaction domain-containing protein n=1 Tax=Evansella clarkii TaxID=79879 RepID=UPI000996FC6A|nr:sigma 54-interacting transcriptional regulator [Evansella clarkii]
MFASDKDTTEMLKAILESIDEGIHVVDKNGITIYYNETAAGHDGLSSREVIGKPLLEVFPSLSHQTSTLLQVIKSGLPIYNQPQSYRNIKGELIDTINTTIPVMADNNIAGAVEIAKDYSRIKKLSNMLIEVQTENDRRKVKAENVSDNQALYRFTDILTRNASMTEVLRKAEKIARTSSPVFVYGETGTGKELLVQSIHHSSPRSNGPFISQNCAAIPPSLLESTLFGTVKGSFTGSEDKEGLFELAHTGTLFLDEIHTLSYELQAKLLRVLEDGVIRRVGSNKSIKTNVRVLAATNEPPEKLLEKKVLRKDLFYRLKVASLSLPPLKERMDDLDVLVPAFIRFYNAQFSKCIEDVNEPAMRAMKSYSWPGNVRELKHCVESAMNLVEGKTIRLEDLPAELLKNQSNSTQQINFFETEGSGLKETLEILEKKLITEKLNNVNGNVKKAAKLLKIPRQTLQYKIAKYNIE